MSSKSLEDLTEESLDNLDNIDISISLKSCSEESLFVDGADADDIDAEAYDDEEETLGSVLVQQLTPAVIAHLRRCFRKATGREKGTGIDRRIEEVMRQAAAAEGVEFPPETETADGRGDMWIDEERFVSAIDDIFGVNKYRPHARQLFVTLGGPGAARLRWRRLARALGHADTPPPLARPRVDIRKLDHAHRETIVKIVSLETPEWFCYAAVSRGGRVGVYSGAMELLYKYEVFYHRTGVSKRFKNRWITDAVFMQDVLCLAISASDRSISIYEAATLTHTLLYCINGVPDVPTCLSYCPPTAGRSALAAGSWRGDVTLLTFLRPRFRLLPAGDQNHTNTYFWTELFSPPHTSYVSITRWRAHARSVTHVAFGRHNLVLSCSHDSEVSFRAKYTTGKLEDYVIKVQRGISCFHYSASIHSLATGSRDGVVRVYTRGQQKPFATMSAPAMAAILDVVLRAKKEMVVAFDADCTLHLWNIYDESLLQTVKIKFPFLGVLGMKPDFGTYCIHPGPARHAARAAPPPSPPSSRRSSVCRAPGGGLALEEEYVKPDDDGTQFLPTFDAPEFLVTCRDHVSIITLSESPAAPAEVLPPPGAELPPKKPEHWHLPTDFCGAPSPPRAITPALPTPTTDRLQPPSPHQPPTMVLRSQSQATDEDDHPSHDLDTLLENAGLKDILEKDFVLMFGLKHDLNKKLAEMEAKRDALLSSVGAGGAFRTLTTSAPVPLGPPDEKMDQYHRIAGVNKYRPHARQLFVTLGGPGAARLRWRRLARALGHADTPPPLARPRVDIRKLDHAHRETIVKIVSLETPEWFCYAAVSRGGRVGVYSGAMELLYKYEVFYHRTGVSKRFKNRWITDAVFMQDVLCLAISASDRSISIYEAATLTHTLLYCINGVPDVPTCLSYCPPTAGRSALAAGSWRGDVTLLTFLRPRFRLLPAGDQNHTNTYFWTELFSPPHTSYVSITRWRAHARSVTHVAFGRHNLVLSCSHDSEVSFRAKYTTGKLEDYVIKVQRGISCFHYSASIHSLATGSRDGVVRVYTRGQQKPFATMSAPAMAAILDVVLRAKKEMVVAFDADCTLHLWNIYDESLLQTVKIKFPFLGVLGMKPDFGTYCIHPGPARHAARAAPPPSPPSSRRSSVCRAPGGGLALEEEYVKPDDDGTQFLPTFDAPEFLVTCRDHVSIITLSESPAAPAEVLPPPGAELPPKKPEHWHLPTDFCGAPSPPRAITPALPTPTTDRLQPPSPHQPPTMVLRSQSQATDEDDHPSHDLDTLLENAGLKDILEKDFVLMFGLKHDLNKKLAEMEAKRDALLSSVGAGGAFRTLTTSAPVPLGPPDEKMDQYHRIAGLFPPSLTATPAHSPRSTPRSRVSKDSSTRTKPVR